MNKNKINLLNLSYLSNDIIFNKNKKNSLINNYNKLKNREITTTKLLISNLSKFDNTENNNKIMNLNNSLQTKLKEIDNIINNLKYIEYYSN